MNERLIDLAVPVKVDSSFHYLFDEVTAPNLQVGSVVQVTFAHRATHAFVLGFPEQTQVDRKKLKPIGNVLITEPLFDAAMLTFFRWVADYYCHPIGEVIAAAVPKQFVTASEKRKEKASKAKPLTFMTLGPTAAPELTGEQAAALNEINEENQRPVLLHGVTGSGKTEVYIRALEKVLAEGKGGMILVPEIALTPQLLGRFSSRFPDKVAVLHSDLTPSERLAQWERLRRGTATIVIGARSAVFAPVKNLGLIIVDEEHETSFKQEDSLRYHARDVAVVRGRLLGSKVILGSATPSLESFANAQSGRYRYVQLPNRVHARPMPHVTMVDMREKDDWVSPTTPWLSLSLLGKMRDTLAKNQQCLLYLNRLGYAHFLYCVDCGHTWRCRQCDVALTYYKHPPKLECHYCGSSHSVPNTCEACSGTSLDTLGVGTEQVEKELKELLPTARIARMDRSVIKTRAELEGILNTVANREVDIVIGTQMLAKGHDFPGIALVGILMADATLNMPDFRANERTFQIITQVSGRAGRGDTPGEVVLQTLNPDAPILHQAIHNEAKAFYQAELASRQQVGFPPVKRLAMLRFQHKNAATVQQFAEQVVMFLMSRQIAAIQILGPAEAPLSRIKNLYRWHCLIKSDNVRDLQRALHMAREYSVHLKSPVQMALDVDPVNCM
jgi:primosomal protein N' (replication factor Y) (superfamily II helicase)